MTGKRETPLWRRYSRMWGADPVRDIDEELEFHLEMRVRDLVRTGLSEREAGERAAVEFGNVTQVRAQMREIGTRRVQSERRTRAFEDLVADLRYAVRHFRRTPLSTLTMILVLSLGLGTNVVLFTVLNSLATLPAPGLARDEALVRIRGTMRMKEVGGVQSRLMSWPEVQAYAGRTDLFSSVAAHAHEIAAVNPGDAAAAPGTANLIYTTANYFSLLKVRPALGREPGAEANVMQMTTSPTAMISYAMWQQKFGGAREVIGRSVRINGVPVEIVGVAPPSFVGTGGSDALTIWVPLAAYPLLEKRSAAVFLSPDSMFLMAAARLQPGVTRKTATPIAAGIAARVFRPGQDGTTTSLPNADVTRTPSETGSADVVAMLASNYRIGDRTDRLVSAAAAVGFALLALLITCTNVSALMVGLAVARRKEIAVRLSLGAPRKRLIRQLLTESVLLALIAAAVGIFVTVAGIRVIGATTGMIQLVVDWRVTLATAAVALATGILFGLSPALHATRVSVGEVLKNSATAVAASRSRLQQALVVAQIALTQPLLLGLGVVITTMVTDLDRRAGAMVPNQIAEIELDVWAGRVSTEERAARIAAVVERVAALPGVIAAMPMQLGTITAPLTVHPADRVTGVTYDPSMVTSMIAAPRGYFNAFGIAIVHGRDFDTAEYAHASHDALKSFSYDAVIIGSDLAQRLWRDANPIGRRLTLALPNQADSAALVVVGVVTEAAAGPSIVNDRIRLYVPYSAMNDGVIARTAGPALPLLNAMRKAVAAEAPQMPITRSQTMEQREIAARSEVLRASSAVAGGGLLALLLSAIGLYAVVSFAVGQRTREIGIRTALGASSRQVVRMFFVKGLALSAFGLLLGLPLSMIVTRVIVSTLNWPVSSSPLLGIAIGAVVLAVASLAVWIPARRASTIPPLLALRTE